jgi:adenine/guanine phosphoribosyltransferase-like PRPP-binding protein
MLISNVQATFEMQSEFLNKGTKVLIVDDLLATGGKIKIL